jgi:hypothetical protein
MRGLHSCNLLRSLVAIGAIVIASGCAHYEYDIVDPPNLAQHIGSNTDTVFSIHPLLYRMRTYENHLVIQVHNPTTQPIRLLGGDSFVVDPQGQSHPLQTQTIAPGSFIKLVLPPLPPEPVPAGPTIGFGIGFADAYTPGGPAWPAWTDPRWGQPRYMAIAADDAYWSWDDESNVRLSLSFDQVRQPAFTHALVIHRRKM